jgi:ferredoxin
MISLNFELARSPNWPSITRRKAPAADADDWQNVTDKLQHLQR